MVVVMNNSQSGLARIPSIPSWKRKPENTYNPDGLNDIGNPDVFCRFFKISRSSCIFFFLNPPHLPKKVHLLWR